MAGGVVQCPDCKRLVDVPSLDELTSIAADGTFKIGAPVDLSEPDRVKSLQHTFARQRVDEDGQEIDLRPTLEEVRNVGLPPDSSSPVYLRPKYDPETGQLVRPFTLGSQLVEPDVPELLPAAGKIRKKELPAPIPGPWSLLGELFRPMNLAVMFFILLMYMLGQLALYIGLLIITTFVPIVLAGLIVAHFVCVIDETGPYERDELPRPLREAGLSEDIWQPLSHALASFLFTYWPILAVQQIASFMGVTAGWFVVLPVLLVCSILFPAVLLTFVTSGSALVNLRPDRLWSVIRGSGAAYWLAAGTWLVLGGLVGWMVFGPGVFIWLKLQAATSYGMKDPFLRFFILIAGWAPASYLSSTMLTVVNIYLGHWFCWQLGLIYRRSHEAFAWAYQRHIPVNRMARMPQQAREARNLNPDKRAR